MSGRVSKKGVDSEEIIQGVVVGGLFAIIVSCGLDHALTVIEQSVNGCPHAIGLFARGEHHRTRHQSPFLTE